METTISYVGGEYAFFSSDEKKWCNRINKLKQDHPDEVCIISAPENNSGCVYARIPANWFKIQPKRVRDISDEQRLILQDRMRNLRKK